jgi:hypothetical protein
LTEVADTGVISIGGGKKLTCSHLLVNSGGEEIGQSFN